MINTIIALNSSIFTSINTNDIIEFVEEDHNQYGNDGFMVKPDKFCDNTYGDIFVVATYDELDIISQQDGYDIISKFTVTYHTTSDDSTLLGYLNQNNMTSVEAFAWGSLIGNKDVIGLLVVDESLFVSWAKYIYPEDQSRMLALITQEGVFCDWGIEIGDRNVVRPYVVTSEHAFRWAYLIPEEKHLMKGFIVEPDWVAAWNTVYPEDPIII